MQGVHGGDIYRNDVRLDFSVNVNPFGMPDAVKKALLNAVKSCGEYPDMEAENLKRAVSRQLSVQEEDLLFGNGASELFMGIVHALRPRKTVIPVPSFYGYEHAAEAAGGEVLYTQMWDKCPEEVLTEDTELLFLANPNNPTGTLLDRKALEGILNLCRAKDIYVVLDESFIEFCSQEVSMVSEAEKYNNLVIVRAFTKLYAIPGVRLGYLVCSNHALLQKIRRQLSEWNVSVLAQMAGIACANQDAYVARTVKYVERERHFLTEQLRSLGMRVFDSEANFILIYSKKPLYDKLLRQGILIRDCESFRGLGQGYYRIAVKRRKENEKLLKAIGECIE